MGDFPEDIMLVEAERLAKADGYLSLMSMPSDRRTGYVRAAKAVLAERERFATLARIAAAKHDETRLGFTAQRMTEFAEEFRHRRDAIESFAAIVSRGEQP